MFILLSMFSAQAQSCNSDAECGGVQHCIFRTTISTEECYPFAWGPFCDEFPGSTTGTCAEDRDQLRNENTDECMRPVGGSTNEGARVTNASCSNSTSRQWYHAEQANGRTIFQNRWSGLCLTQVGTRYEQRFCNHSPLQLFELDDEPDGSFRMFHPGSDDTCVRAHPNVTDPFRNNTCDVNNTSSRHWYYD